MSKVQTIIDCIEVLEEMKTGTADDYEIDKTVSNLECYISDLNNKPIIDFDGLDEDKFLDRLEEQSEGFRMIVRDFNARDLSKG